MPLESDAPYTCPWCFEQNYVAVDPTGGKRQTFSEDCPVCCNPIAFEAGFDEAGEAIVNRAERE
jgi:hypothetical protein